MGIVTFLFYGAGLLAQQAPVPANDRVELFTDRTLYVSGEKVSFSAFISNESGFASAVLYLEIVTNEGYRLVAGKYTVNQGKSFGKILLPNDMLSGVYFVKAYTKWMRNFSPMDYNLTSIKVVNPYRVEAYRSTNGYENYKTQYQTDSTLEYGSPLIRVDKKVYKIREQAHISVLLNSTLDSMSFAMLSVVPLGSVNSYFKHKIIGSSQPEGNVQFLPEIKGITISGKVIDRDASQGIPFATVNLSLLGGSPDFISTKCDNFGRFNITPPHYYARREMFIGTEDRSDIRAQIKIDLDYCSRELSLPYIPFTLNEKERLLSLQFAKNLQVDSIFNFNAPQPLQNVTSQSRVPFYGTPDNTITFDRYINLLSVEEYFHELIPQVTIRGSKGRKQFKFLSSINDMNVYDPLVLVDYIAVDWADRILSVSPASILKIDIINKPYYKGERTFGGIISFYSKKGDLASIELPSSGVFFGYDFFYKSLPENATIENINTSHPDTRNTVLWLPKIATNGGFAQQILFTTPETPGEYQIILRIITPLGVKNYTDTFFVE